MFVLIKYTFVYLYVIIYILETQYGGYEGWLNQGKLEVERLSCKLISAQDGKNLTQSNGKGKEHFKRQSKYSSSRS